MVSDLRCIFDLHKMVTYCCRQQCFFVYFSSFGKLNADRAIVVT
jgi:hypothetical protein